MNTQTTHRQLVVIQPTPFCNIDCSYCYLSERDKPVHLPFSILKSIYTACFNNSHLGSPITFLWHAGEPLTLPVDYYRSAFELAGECNDFPKRPYDHYIQTNGMLLNDKWIELIKSYNVEIGVSIDGPSFIHDRVRRTRRGTGTHDEVMKGVKLLQSSGIKFNSIAVLTAESLNYPDEIFDFFYENEIHDIGFNIDEIEGPYKTSTFQNDCDGRYRSFILRFLELVEHNEWKMKVREFQGIFSTLCGPNFGTFVDSTNYPLGVINFDYSGNFSTYSPELLGARSERFNNFFMGNILKDKLDDISSNNVFQAVTEEIQRGLNACKSSCQYWGFCGGGPPANKFFEHGQLDTTETVSCRVHKKILVDAVLEYAEAPLSK